MASEQTDGPNRKGDHTTSNVDQTRRSVLKMAGMATAVGSGLFAGVQQATAGTTTSDFQFDTVLDAVDDLGADPNGGQDVIPLIESAYSSNTKIEFPPGTYKLGSRWIDNSSAVSHFGIVGTGSSPRDVQFLVPDDRFNDRVALGLWGPKSEHLFRNWSIQLTDNGDRGFPMRVEHEGGTLFEDLEWLGRIADEQTCDKGYAIAVAATTRDGVNTYRRLTFGVDAPAVRPEYPNGRYAIYIDSRHDGEVVLDDLHIERMSSSAFRLGAASGVVTVLGGYFANNNNGNIRLSGGDHPSKHSVVDGAVALQDNLTEPGNNVHIDNSDEYHAGVVFRNCDIISTDSTAGQPVIASPDWADHGSITFLNCRVKNDIDQLTMSIGDVSMSDDDIVVDGCSFTGSGYGLDVNGRDGSVVKDSCFDMPNGSISGLDTQNISSGNCPQPSTSGDGSDSSSDTDTNVAVSTGSSTAGETTATLNGSLDSLGGASSADVSFEYRETGASSWTETAAQTLSSSGSVSQDVSGLASGTDYEFRALAAASDGDTDTGSTATFTTASGLPNELLIDGSDAGNKVYYTITVSEDIEKGEDANDNDTVSGTTADGQVWGGIDTYDFAGEVTDVEVSEDVPIYVNGTRLDLSQFEHPNELMIDGSDIGNKVYYTITVSDEIVKGEDANDNDTVSGTTADGQVNGGIDTYDFAGEVTDVEVSEDVPISVNGTQLDLSQFEAAPTVDRLEVSEADSPNPHANIVVEWDVSDADADLASGLVEVRDSSGAVVDSSETSIAGETHFGVDYFEIRNVDGQTFDIEVTVTDSAGNQTTDQASVTE